jgi:hypothetical protein
MRVIVVDVLNNENFTVYSTWIMSHTTISIPRNMNNEPRSAIGADILGSPDDKGYEYTHRLVELGEAMMHYSR